MRVLITGGAGLLGGALLKAAPRSWEMSATQRHTPAGSAPAYTVELSDSESVRALWRQLQPDLVIHTAYSTRDLARDIWGATRSVADACSAIGASLIHLSTDALLDGENAPYAEEAEPAPVYPYGVWKARAERYVRERLPGATVVRTSLITSFAPLDPGSARVAEKLRRSEPVRLFADELRCPIGVEDLALQILEIAAMPAPSRAGMWNLVGPEALSRYALGLLICADQALDPAGIMPCRSQEATERRPRDLRLLTSRADRTLRTRARPVSMLALPASL